MILKHFVCFSLSCLLLSFLRLNPVPSACYLSMVLSASFISFIFIHFIYYYQRKCFSYFPFLSLSAFSLPSVSFTRPRFSPPRQQSKEERRIFLMMMTPHSSFPFKKSNQQSYGTEHKNLINISFASFISNQNVNFIKGKTFPRALFLFCREID
jgi:hypothetical protein